MSSLRGKSVSATRNGNLNLIYWWGVLTDADKTALSELLAASWHAGNPNAPALELAHMALISQRNACRHLRYVRKSCITWLLSNHYLDDGKRETLSTH